MTACADREHLLHALLDDELDAANAASCEAHVKSCPGCAAELEHLRTLRDMLGNPALRHATPEGLRARIEAALPHEAPARPAAPPPGPTSRFAWAALGAGLSAAASIALVVGTRTPALPDIEQQIVASHVRSLLATHLVDVVTSDQHVVKPWFNGRIDFAPPTPDLKAQGFPLAGGRLDYIGGRVVPAIVYRRRLHTINLFAWPAGSTAAPATAQFEGYNLRHWQQGGLDLWAVSDVSPADLALFEQDFAAAR
jgi:anti-sigma factor RsiW